MQLNTMLQILLKKKNMSLTGLAKQSGMPVSTLHSWTTGKKTLNLEQLKKVSLTLEVPIHDLVFGCPDPFESKDGEILQQVFSGDVRVTVHKILRGGKK
jgi:transcriptional regulator with XRE-family HTH domain